MDSLPANTFLPSNCSALPYVPSRCSVFSESQRAALCPLYSCPAPARIPLCVAEGSACQRRYSLALMLCCLFGAAHPPPPIYSHNILRNPKRRFTSWPNCRFDYLNWIVLWEVKACLILRDFAPVAREVVSEGFRVLLVVASCPLGCVGGYLVWCRWLLK